MSFVETRNSTYINKYYEGGNLFHNCLLRIMKQAGIMKPPKANEAEGICHGFTRYWGIAVINKGVQYFDKCIDHIFATPHIVKQIRNNKNPDIRLLLRSMAILQDPDTFENEIGKKLFQHQFNDIFNYLRKSGHIKSVDIENIFTFAAINEFEKFKKFIKDLEFILRTVAQGSLDEIPIIISDGKHTMGFILSSINDGLYILDINQLFKRTVKNFNRYLPIKSNEIADCLMREGFNEDGNLRWLVTIDINANHPLKNDLRNNLDLLHRSNPVIPMLNKLSSSGETIPFIAAEDDRYELIERIPESRKSTLLTVTDDSGKALIHIASGLNNINTVETLLKNGLSANRLDAHQKTAAHYAAENGNLEILTLLHQYNADLNAKNNLLFTPAHYAVDSNFYPDILNFLANHHADLNQQTTNGYTPALLALIRLKDKEINVRVNCKKCIQIFAEQKIDFLVNNNQGISALSFAISQQWWDMVMPMLLSMNNLSRIPAAMLNDLNKVKSELFVESLRYLRPSDTQNRIQIIGEIMNERNALGLILQIREINAQMRPSFHEREALISWHQNMSYLYLAKYENILVNTLHETNPFRKNAAIRRSFEMKRYARTHQNYANNSSAIQFNPHPHVSDQTLEGYGSFFHYTRSKKRMYEQKENLHLPKRNRIL